jgi:CTP:phosphocholine cytidylyltransferase-like protein
MKATLSQKLNILKSKKTFINYTLDNEQNLVNYVINDNFMRYKNQYQTFAVLDLFKEQYILNSEQNYTLKQILKGLNIK